MSGWLRRRVYGRSPGAVKVIWDAVDKFRDDDGLLLAGALAFFSALSLAPLLLVVVGAATFLVDEGPVRRVVLEQAQQLAGQEGRAVATNLLDRFNGPSGGVLSITLGALALVFGATSGFVHLRTALNRVFDVRERPRHRLLRRRLLGLLMVLALGVLLLSAVLLSTALSILRAWMSHATGFTDAHPWADRPWYALDWATSLLVLTLLIAAVFKALPDVRLAWRDVWLGAAVTTALFTGGKMLVGSYLGTKGAVSAFGAAGSFVVVLLWLYYSAIALLFGAELTQVLQARAGRAAPPRRGAVRDGDADAGPARRDEAPTAAR